MAKTVTGDAVYTAEWKKLASPEEPSKPADENKDDTDSPKTGDDSNAALWFALLSASGAGMLAAAAYGRKRKYSK